MKLFELFDKPYPMDFGEEDSDGNFIIRVNLQDDSMLKIFFDCDFVQGKIYELSFTKTSPGRKVGLGTFRATGDGDQYKIFATVLKATQNFIKQKHPNVIYFTGGKEKPGRIKLYDRMLAKFADAAGYILSRAEHFAEVEYVLRRKGYKAGPED